MRTFGAFILKYRVPLLAGVIILTILFSLYVPKLTVESNMKTWLSEDDRLYIKYDRFKKQFPSAEIIVVAYETADPFAADEINYLGNLTRKLEQIPYCVEVTSMTNAQQIEWSPEGLTIQPLVTTTSLSAEERVNLSTRITRNPFYDNNLISKDNSTLGLFLAIDIPIDEQESKGRIEVENDIVDDILSILDKEQEATGRVFHIGGIMITHNKVNEVMEHDMVLFMPLATILILILLLCIFRNLGCVLAAISTVILALVWTVGLKGMLDMPITIISTTLFALIIVIGIANSIHFISHYRIEVARLEDKREAILETYARAGMPCFLTSLTTAIGFSALSVSRFVILRNLGIFASFGIMSAFILTMIIVPNVLLVTRVNPRFHQMRQSRILEWIGRFNLKRSKVIMAVMLVVFIIMGFGITKIKVGQPFLEYLKEDSRLRRDADFIDQKLSGISGIEVILYGQNGSFNDQEVLTQIDRLQARVENHSKVVTSYSMVDYLKLLNRALHHDQDEHYRLPLSNGSIDQLLLLYQLNNNTGIKDYTSSDYAVTRISIRTCQMDEGTRGRLRDEIQEFIDQNFQEFKVDITGIDDIVHETLGDMAITLTQSLGLSLAVIFGLMMLIFGPKGGLASILPNVFPIIFVLGFMGYFQFHLNLATATIAAIAIGLVVDDTIHYFFHFRYEYRQSGERDHAMRTALQKVGRAMCITSLSLVLGFLIFSFSDIVILIDFGILVSIAIVMALIGDLFIGSVFLARLRIFAKNGNQER